MTERIAQLEPSFDHQEAKDAIASLELTVEKSIASLELSAKRLLGMRWVDRLWWTGMLVGLLSAAAFGRF